MVSRIMHVISVNPVKGRVFVIMKDGFRPTKSDAIAKIIYQTRAIFCVKYYEYLKKNGKLLAILCLHVTIKRRRLSKQLYNIV